MQKKSNSTGSSKRWKFRNLLHRSSSDGKDTIVFLTPIDHRTSEKAQKKVAAQRRLTDGKSTSSGQRAAKAHEAHYLKNRAIRQSNQRRSFLPYRQDLVGFFATANGLSTTTQPF
ncbi:hypothetical protein Nepgr_023323 [Nepenthes gracilis]|uniref:Uncharacterized protein n=1 Tax=Nepenthes gracilis TaxID=150966 RepID=A0AAD3XZA4_NEPGR|nr:hypothetical protein Nepgr_023323 [Nepenthes gracilis]